MQYSVLTASYKNGIHLTLIPRKIGQELQLTMTNTAGSQRACTYEHMNHKTTL